MREYCPTLSPSQQFNHRLSQTKAERCSGETVGWQWRSVFPGRLTSGTTIRIVLMLAALAVVALTPPVTFADDFDDEEPVIVYLKKIRDSNGIYLRDVTKSLAKSVSSSGEYQVKRYNPNSYKSGPVITVSAPGYDVAENTKSSATKKVTNAGIKMVSSLGGLFGKDKEAAELEEVQTELNDEDGLLNMIPDNVEILVQMRSNVSLVDTAADVESSVPVLAERVYSNKQQYMDERDALFADALLKAVMMSLADMESGDEF